MSVLILAKGKIFLMSPTTAYAIPKQSTGLFRPKGVEYVNTLSNINQSSIKCEAGYYDKRT